MFKPSHRLGECPNGVEWCDPQDHLCGECEADWTDRVYDEMMDRLAFPTQHGKNVASCNTHTTKG